MASMKLFSDEAPNGRQRVMAQIVPGPYVEVRSQAHAYRLADEHGIPHQDVDFGETRDALPEEDPEPLPPGF
jgi:hypothetical protein